MAEVSRPGCRTFSPRPLNVLRTQHTKFHQRYSPIAKSGAIPWRPGESIPISIPATRRPMSFGAARRSNRLLSNETFRGAYDHNPSSARPADEDPRWKMYYANPEAARARLEQLTSDRAKGRFW